MPVVDESQKVQSVDFRNMVTEATYVVCENPDLLLMQCMLGQGSSVSRNHSDLFGHFGAVCMRMEENLNLPAFHSFQGRLKVTKRQNLVLEKIKVEGCCTVFSPVAQLLTAGFNVDIVGISTVVLGCAVAAKAKKMCRTHNFKGR